MTPASLTQQRLCERRRINFETDAHDWIAGGSHFADLGVKDFDVVALTGVEFDIESPAPNFEELPS